MPTKGEFVGNKHHLWTETPSYNTVHNWIRTHYGRAYKCENCNGKEITKSKRKHHWANISGNYERNIKDWIQLCVSCHKKMDRGNKCSKGHEYSKENTYFRNKTDKYGITRTSRVCKECQRNYSKVYKLKLQVK